MKLEEYQKKLDDAIADIATHLDKMTDPHAKEIRDRLTKLGVDINCTETGIVMATAIDVAKQLISSIYNRTKHSHTECGIDKMIECELKGDPFFGDIVKKKTED